MSDHIADASKMTPHRIQLRRTKGWRLPEGAIKVDRTTPWGNPFKVEYDGWDEAPGWYVTSHIGHRERVNRRSDGIVRAVELHKEWLKETRRQTFHDQLRPDPIDIMKGLRGRDLACWCPLDQPCHADVLLALANAPLRCEAA